MGSGIIIYEYQKDIKIWDNTTKFKDVFEEVTHFTIILLSCNSFIVPIFLLNTMIE